MNHKKHFWKCMGTLGIAVVTYAFLGSAKMNESIDLSIHATTTEQSPITETLETLVQENHPVSKKSSFLSYLPTRNNPDGSIKYLVNYGDTLWNIAEHYAHGNTLDMIKQISERNTISNNDSLQPYQLLSIPIASENPIDYKNYDDLSPDERIAFLASRTPNQANKYIEDFVTISESLDIDPRLALALSWKESEFNTNARAVRNGQITGQGIMQLNPQVHPVSSDYRENISYALSFLKDTFENYKSTSDSDSIAFVRTLAAYNAGQRKINRMIANGDWNGTSIEEMPIRETRIFLSKISNYLNYFDAYL